MQQLVYPVILAGGSGTRLWPSSREKHPKQFIPLIDGKSLFQETCLRFSDAKKFAPITIVTHEEHRFLVRDQLLELGITNAVTLAEPTAKNTTAACLSAAYFLKNTYGDIPIIFSPADHSIKNVEPLFTSITNALPFVLKGLVCVFGITPTHPHTGYGYITGSKVLGKGIVEPLYFVEKPNKEHAEKIIKEGAFWNSGLYFCTPSTLEQEAALYVGELQKILKDFFSVAKATQNGFIMIDKNVYERIDSISIDKGITERTKKLVLAPTPITWNDLGSWSSLYEHFSKNDEGNVIRGDSLVLETQNSYIESNNRLISVLGLEHVGVVETADAVLVFSLKESEKVKKIVETLTEHKRQETITHTTVHKPWGKYTILGDDHTFKSKKITVLPGAELSLQRHKHRAEHWIVIQGVATVTRNDEVFELRENESTFLPMGSTHRLQNKHDEILTLVEIQTGSYFGEDDIERFLDTYGRI
jgi:mannose-1-phosphate guanylyltransferase/mannose-6-phosphate isomerase